MPGRVLGELMNSLQWCGEHGFPPAGETSKQMWLNETLRKQQVRFGCNPINNALSSGWKRADFDHGGVVCRDMHDDLFVVDNVLPVFAD